MSASITMPPHFGQYPVVKDIESADSYGADGNFFAQYKPRDYYSALPACKKLHALNNQCEDHRATMKNLFQLFYLHISDFL